MVTIDEYSRMVSAIHAAAITPEHWLNAMTLIQHAFDATSSAVLVPEDSGRTIKYSCLSSDAMQAYADYYCTVDYVLEAVESGPVGIARNGEQLVALGGRSEFLADWLLPNRMLDGLFVRLTPDDQPMCFLIAAPRSDSGYATADRITVFNALIPHLQQALRTQGYLADLQLLTDNLSEAIDGMHRAVAIVGPESTVLHTNSSARKLLAQPDGLHITRGRLSAARAAVDAELRRCVDGALGMRDGGVRTGRSFACQRGSGRRPYVVHVSPFRIAERRTPRALVVIVDPDTEWEPPADVLRRVFGLTEAEAAVAVRVARGDGLRPIADELSLSMATVKTHLQHVFAKTDTHRQAELVRLMLTLTP